MEIELDKYSSHDDTIITIVSVKIHSLPSDAFISFPNLKMLTLSSANMYTLAPNLFDNLVGLHTLNLSNNTLMSLDSNIFRNLSSLCVLDLHNNCLTSLPDTIFDGLPKLHTLDISLNGISYLSDTIFDNLTELISIKLEINHIAYLPDNIFSKVSALIQLSLSGNDLSSVPSSITLLTNLESLDISINEITHLPDDFFTLLTRLTELNISDNLLTTIPSSILNCRQMYSLCYYQNEITPDIRIQRFIDRMNNPKTHGIFTNAQNIHASSIQNSVAKSINNLFKDPYDCSKDDIIKECLTWDIPCLPDLLTYLDHPDVHSTLLVSFYDVFVKVFGRIMNHSNKTDIICRLNDELKESECKCFTGRLTRLVNCLVGYYDDIEISISNNERISAIILSTLDGNEMTDELKEMCVDKLKAIDISDEEIDKWLSHS